ncbi:MAG: N-acetyl-alpha-D-glucosaminyl L-malate synthase BshA, partial [Bacillota bacterium]
MNIGITCHPSHGGSGAVAAELGKHLADRGHSVHFISYDLPFRLDAIRPNLQFHQVEVPSYPLFVYPPYQLALANKMAEVVQYEALDILHAHYAVPHAASAYLARAMTGGRVKVITTLHGTDVTLVGADPSFAGIIKFLLETSDGVTAVSDDLKRVTIERFGVTRPIERIYNFIDPVVCQRVPAPDLARRFTPGKERVALHISNFRPLKRVPLAVEAFAAAAHDIPAVLLLAGDGPEAGEARATARRLR